MAVYRGSDTVLYDQILKRTKKGTECSTSRIFIPEYPVAIDSYRRPLRPKGPVLPGLLGQCTQGFPMSIKFSLTCGQAQIITSC